MLAKIKAFFEDQIRVDDSAPLTEEQRHLACAALLIEVATVDQEFDQREFDVLQKILQGSFGLSQTDCDTLTRLAQDECEQAVSTYQFTRMVNDHCTNEEKFTLIVGMWRIAYADGDLDKYEEYIIRKVSDLLHLAHGDFIRAKHLAREQAFPSN